MHRTYRLTRRGGHARWTVTLVPLLAGLTLLVGVGGAHAEEPLVTPPLPPERTVSLSSPEGCCGLLAEQASFLAGLRDHGVTLADALQRERRKRMTSGPARQMADTAMQLVRKVYRDVWASPALLKHMVKQECIEARHAGQH